MQQSIPAGPSRRVNIRSVALPAEHGGWGFLLEPILLGLLLVFTTQGFAFALGMLALFLVHQPLKLALKDLRSGRRLPRTRWAVGFAGGYGLLALIGFVLAFANARAEVLVPIVIVLPLFLIQAWYDLQNRSRSLIAEISGAVALGASAPVIVLLGPGCWTLQAAMLLFLIPAGRAISSILYVRGRLRLSRGKQEGVMLGLAASLLAPILYVLLALLDLIPWLVPAAFLMLALRAERGLRPDVPRVRASVIGMREMVFGLLLVIITVAGYSLNW